MNKLNRLSDKAEQFIRNSSYYTLDIGSTDSEGLIRIGSSLSNIGLRADKGGEHKIGESKLLRRMDRDAIVVGDKFISGKYGKISDVLESTGKGRAVVEMAKRLENGTCCIMNIQVGDKCMYKLAAGGSIKNIMTDVCKISVGLDLDNKLSYRVVTGLLARAAKDRGKARIEEYGDTFTLGKYELYNPKSATSNKLMRFSRYGYIKPIEIETADNIYIIDNKDILIKDTEEVVGEIRTGIALDKKKIDDKMLNMLDKNSNYIIKMSKYIVPYELSDTNKVKLRK